MDLSEFNKTHYTWDPWFMFHDGVWYMYCISSPKDSNPGVPFFRWRTTYELFSSSDWEDWEHEGTVWNTGAILAAGCTVAKNEQFHLFGSTSGKDERNGAFRQYSWSASGATPVDFSKTTKNLGFNVLAAGRPKDELEVYPSQAETGWRAWRDPFLYSHVTDGTKAVVMEFLYVVTGGFRWAARSPGMLAVATADSLGRPWMLHQPALMDQRFAEIERPHVFKRTAGDYLLAFSSWPNYVSRWMEPQTHSVYIARSDNPLGPFKVDPARPYFIDESDGRTVGGYGMGFCEAGGRVFGLNWQFLDKTIDPARVVEVDLDKEVLTGPK